MPVEPVALRTTKPPPDFAVSANCASPSAVSAVVMGLPCESLRHPRSLPLSSTSGTGSGVRPPICTTLTVMPSSCAALAMEDGSPSRSSPSVTSTSILACFSVEGSRLNRSCPAAMARANEVPPTGMSFGVNCRKNCAMAVPSDVNGNVMGSPAKATAPNRAPRSSEMSRETSLLARSVRDGETSRANMLLE